MGLATSLKYKEIHKQNIHPKNLQFKTYPIRMQKADEFLNAILSLEGESIRR